MSLHCGGSIPSTWRGYWGDPGTWVRVGGHPKVRGVLPKGPQGSPSRLPSPRRWESELRLFSAESWSVLTKLCLRTDGAEPPTPRPPGPGQPHQPGPALVPFSAQGRPPGLAGVLGAGQVCPTVGDTSCTVCCPSRSRCR